MQLFISPQNPVPLYQQIVDQIRGRIVRGELVSGAMLPSIRELARDMTISVITTKRAYLELEREGLIVTRPGVGTFVAALDGTVLRRARRSAVRETLRGAVHKAREMGLGRQDIADLLNEILVEEEDT